VSFDINSIRHDFPVLDNKVYDKHLVYLDNAATTQKSRDVINRVSDYYRNENANIHRGVHYLSQQATEAFENARKTVKEWINAEEAHEIIFTKGATEAVNLVAHSFARPNLETGDEVIISEMEHHSNLVPWQVVCEEKGAVLKVIPFSEDGELDLAEYKKFLSEKTKLVAITHVSNVLGTINPVKHMIDIAHKQGIPVLVDGAQAIPHSEVDVQALGCDFYCFSAHKVYGPMGIGVLYGKSGLLEKMPPYQTGGEMVDNVTIEKTTYNELPYKFEAGTPNVAGVVGLEAALKYIEKVELKDIENHEQELLDYATVELLKIEGITIYGTSDHKCSVVSFNMEGVHPYDAGIIIDQMGVAVRTGHHCAQPIMDHYGVPGMIRASFGLYNTLQEVDRLVEAVKQARKMLG